jgi:thiol-disulfide isomerase/thioredoxin
MERRRAIALASGIALVVGVITGALLARRSDARLDAHLTTPGRAPEPAGIKPVAKADGKPLPAGEFMTLRGTKAKFDDLKGKPLIVNMWAESCVPCVTEMPAFESVHHDLGDKVTIIGMNAQDGVATAKAFAAKVGVTYDLWLDNGGAAQAALGVTVLPTTIFVSAEGTVVKTSFGALTAEKLKTTITELFG